MTIVKTLERKTPIAEAAPNRYMGLRNVAASLDRRLADQATIELLTEALHRLVVLVYAQDSMGFVNVDGITGRILLPVPMGRAGRSIWGLYPSEGDALRTILRGRQAAGSALFLYDRGRRCWLLNLAEFANQRAALAYLKHCPITLEEFRVAHAKALGKAAPR
jgi:hypothetical protein